MEGAGDDENGLRRLQHVPPKRILEGNAGGALGAIEEDDEDDADWNDADDAEDNTDGAPGGPQAVPAAAPHRRASGQVSNSGCPQWNWQGYSSKVQDDMLPLCWSLLTPMRVLTLLLPFSR